MVVHLLSKRLLIGLSIGYAAVLSGSSLILYHLIRSGIAGQELCQAHLITDTAPPIQAIYTAFFTPFLPSGLTLITNLIIFCLITVGLPLLLLRNRSEQNAPLGPAVFIATVLLTLIVPLSIHTILQTLSASACVSMGYLISPLVSGIAGIAIFTLIAKQTACSLNLRPLLQNYACLFIASALLFAAALILFPAGMIPEAATIILSMNYGWALALLVTIALSQTEKTARITAALFIPVILLVPILIGLII